MDFWPGEFTFVFLEGFYKSFFNEVFDFFLLGNRRTRCETISEVYVYTQEEKKMHLIKRVIDY